jgi:hypothetical protein
MIRIAGGRGDRAGWRHVIGVLGAREHEAVAMSVRAVWT